MFGEVLCGRSFAIIFETLHLFSEKREIAQRGLNRKITGFHQSYALLSGDNSYELQTQKEKILLVI